MTFKIHAAIFNRLFSPIDISKDEPTAASVLYLLASVVLLISIVIFIIRFEASWSVIRLFTALTMYYMWFNWRHNEVS